MDIRKALLVKSLRKLLRIRACLSYNNKCKHRYNHRYPRGDQNEYEFTIR